MFLNYYSKVRKKEEKNVLLIEQSYKYWCEALFEKCMRIFEWSIPEKCNLPQKEIEMRLLLNGFCGFVQDPLSGWTIASGSLSGTTKYWDEFTDFTFAAPKCRGGNFKIGEKCVVINNTQLRNSLYPMICRYASLLAHSEISLKCSLVNLRENNTFAVEDDDTAESVRDYHAKCYKGDTDVIVDKSLINAVQNVTTNRTSNTSVIDCIDAKNELLRMFFNEIGVRYSRDKKERMIESEVSNDTQMLLINISDMLAQRERACNEIKKVFDLDFSVKLSKEFDILERGKKNDDIRISNCEPNESANQLKLFE